MFVQVSAFSYHDLPTPLDLHLNRRTGYVAIHPRPDAAADGRVRRRLEEATPHAERDFVPNASRSDDVSLASRVRTGFLAGLIVNG